MIDEAVYQARIARLVRAVARLRRETLDPQTRHIRQLNEAINDLTAEVARLRARNQ